MKIAFFEISDWEANYVREKLTGQELYFFAGPLIKGDTLDMEYYHPMQKPDLHSCL
jgi:hypothetical protein